MCYYMHEALWSGFVAFFLFCMQMVILISNKLNDLHEFKKDIFTISLLKFNMLKLANNFNQQKKLQVQIKMIFFMFIYNNRSDKLDKMIL